MDFQKLKDAIDSCSEQLSNMIPLEIELMSALASNNTDEIEAKSSALEAAKMQLDNCEHNRLSVQKELGLKNLSSSDLIEKVPAEMKKEFSESLNRLRAAAEEFKLTNQKCRDVGKASLAFFQNIDERGRDLAKKDTQITYGKNKSVSTKFSSGGVFANKKI